MVNDTEFIKITSPNQFEIRAGYLSNQKNEKQIDYDINIYMFIPKNLGINDYTYTKEDFYGDYISYIRLITPRYKLGLIYKKMEDIISSIKKNIGNDKEILALLHELKMLVCSYITYLRKFVNDIKTTDKININKIIVLLERIKRFDKLKNEILNLEDLSNNEELIFVSQSAPEYLSLTTQHYLFKLNIYLNTYGKDYIDCVNKIVHQINQELKFCKKNGFPIISNDEYQNEKVIYRYSVFKKYFYSVLYLHQKRKEDGKNIKEFYYAIAAGISMVFTTAIVFFTQQKYGNFTLTFFAALVISYMFKDRIKEAYRKYFDKKMQLKIYDYKEKIYDNQKKSIFSFIKEKVRFINKVNLNDDVVKTRLSGTQNRLSTWFLGEEILKYEKHITLYNRNIQDYYNNTINGIHNIMRFDISKFLKKMDSPKIPLYRTTHNKIYGHKVYHVNVVVEFISKNEKKLHKARIVLTKKGIKRIELPQFGIKFFHKNIIKKDINWLGLKKSGLVKRIEK
jgi:hypothetical protein